MSRTADAEAAIAGCRPSDGTPVAIDASALESTADAYLKSLKRAFDAEDYVPDTLVVEAEFDAGSSLTTQAEADRIRKYLSVADYLGAGTVRLDVGTVADPRTVRPAIAALSERAEREGLALVVDGADAHDL